MQRETDFTFPNPPDDVPPSPLMEQARKGFMLPWPRKPIGKPKGGKPGAKAGNLPRPSKSGVGKLKTRSYSSPYL